MANARSVVLVVIDGLRPDGLEQAATPRIDDLIARGAYAPAARTTMPSVSLPCHMSLFLGVPPERHGITTNVYAPQVRPVPGIIDVAHDAGLTTAAFYNWEPLRDLSRPGALTASAFLRNCDEPGGDLALARLAADYLGANPVGFCFIYLGYTDVAGHDFGWMSEPYLEAVARADQALGMVIDAVEGSGRGPATAWIVTSDHGGHERTHGTDRDEDMVTPIVVSGPGVPVGLSIDGAPSILDLAPTVAALLGLEAPREWVGRSLVA